MALSDRARDFWDRISPRERAMVVVLAIGIPIALAVWLSFAISDGLAEREARNEETREALRVIAERKASTATQPAEEAIPIPTEPVALETYISKAAETAGIKLKGAIETRPKSAPKNGFVTTTVSCAVDDVTTEQLRAFLDEIEKNKVVVTTHIDVRRDFRDKKKLDASLEISTYHKEAPKAAGSGAGSADADDADRKGS